jgi:intracellular septation protein A
MKYLRLAFGIFVIILSILNMVFLLVFNANQLNSYRQVRIQVLVSLFGLIIGIYFINKALKKNKSTFK